MKTATTLIILMTILVFPVKGQHRDSTKIKNVNRALTERLNVSEKRADEIQQSLTYNQEKIAAVFKDKTLTPQERLARINKLEMERKIMINKNVTSEQQAAVKQDQAEVAMPNEKHRRQLQSQDSLRLKRPVKGGRVKTEAARKHQ